VQDLSTIADAGSPCNTREPLKELLLILRTMKEGIENKEMRNEYLDKATVLKSSTMSCMELISDKHNKHQLIPRIVAWVCDKSGKSDDEFNMMCGDIPETARALHDTLGISKLFASIPQDIRDISDTPA
jgi:hypothetical protein